MRRYYIMTWRFITLLHNASLLHNAALQALWDKLFVKTGDTNKTALSGRPLLWPGGCVHCLSPFAEFVGSARWDAAEVRHGRQPAQLRHGDGARRQRELLRRAEDAAVSGRRAGRGVLSGRGPEGPHAVAGQTSFPAQRRQPGGVMTSQRRMTSQRNVHCVFKRKFRSSVWLKVKGSTSEFLFIVHDEVTDRWPHVWTQCCFTLIHFHCSSIDWWLGYWWFQVWSGYDRCLV